MLDGRRRQTAILLLMPAAVVGVSLAGCTSSSSSHGASAALSSTKGAKADSFSAAKLRAALLTRVNGVGPASASATGDYTSIAARGAGQQAAKGAPKACAQATETGLDAAVLAGANAASVAFKVGGNDVSELLAAAPGTAAASALAGRLPASCARYKAAVDGTTVTYSVTESAVGGIGKQAKALNVSSAAAGSDAVWMLVYRGTGFVGAVTVVGPNSSQSAVRELGQQAYDYAAKSLS
jgi:hypothetical protein